MPEMERSREITALVRASYRYPHTLHLYASGKIANCINSEGGIVDVYFMLFSKNSRKAPYLLYIYGEIGRTVDGLYPASLLGTNYWHCLGKAKRQLDKWLRMLPVAEAAP